MRRRRRWTMVVRGCHCEARRGRRSARRGCLWRRAWSSLRMRRMLERGMIEVVRVELAELRMRMHLS
jgi:hypothetical protein